MPDYTLSAKVTGDSSSYQRAMEEADNSTKQFQTNTSSLGSKLAGTLKTGLSVAVSAIAGVATAMGAGAVAGLKYNATIEQYETSFETMTGSAEKAAEVVERLKKLGAETPFEMPQLADVTQLLMNYGFTADEAIDRMKMLGDISQGSADKMSRIATAYGQMSSAGKVQLEDVKQMIEAGFNPLQEISESTGESMSSLYDRISAGTLSVDEITASMQRATSEGGKYFQSMEKQSQTVSGMISTLKDNAQQLLGEVVQPLTEGVATKLLPAAISAIDQLTVAFQTGGTTGLIAAGSKILTDIVLGIAQALPGLITTSVQIIQSLVTNLSANMPQLVSAGGQILLSLAQGIVSMLPSLGELALSLVTNIAQGVSANAPQMVPKGVDVVMKLVNGLISNLPQLVSAGLDMIVSLAKGIGNSIPQIVQQAPAIIGRLTATLISLLPQIISAGVQIVASLASGIIKSIPKIPSAIRNLISQAKAAFSNVDWGSIGRNIISGVARGITGAAGSIVSAAKKAAQNALDSAKSFLGIHSPSTVFRDEVGKNMALGMGVGFEDNIPIRNIKQGLDLEVSSLSMAAPGIGSNVDVTSLASYGSTQTYSDSLMGLGEYIVAAMIEYGDRQGEAIERGISKMGVYFDSRQVGRVIDKMGYVRA